MPLPLLLVLPLLLPLIVSVFVATVGGRYNEDGPRVLPAPAAHRFSRYMGVGYLGRRGHHRVRASGKPIIQHATPEEKLRRYSERKGRWLLLCVCWCVLVCVYVFVFFFRQIS